MPKKNNNWIWIILIIVGALLYFKPSRETQTDAVVTFTSKDTSMAGDLVQFSKSMNPDLLLFAFIDLTYDGKWCCDSSCSDSCSGDIDYCRDWCVSKGYNEPESTCDGGNWACHDYGWIADCDARVCCPPDKPYHCGDNTCMSNPECNSCPASHPHYCESQDNCWTVPNCGVIDIGTYACKCEPSGVCGLLKTVSQFNCGPCSVCQGINHGPGSCPAEYVESGNPEYCWCEQAVWNGVRGCDRCEIWPCAVNQQCGKCIIDDKCNDGDIDCANINQFENCQTITYDAATVPFKGWVVADCPNNYCNMELKSCTNIPCRTDADTNCNAAVDWEEMNTAIDKWLDGNYFWAEINEIVGGWLNG